MSSQQETHKQTNLNQQAETVSLLRHMAIFRHMDSDMVKLFGYLAHRESYKAGDIILQQHRPCDRFLLIVTGKVDICQEHNHRYFHLQTLTPEGMNYFGELALLARFKWFFTARAASDVELISISRKAFVKVMERFPEKYTNAVDKIVNLRIDRFVDQTNYLLDNLKEEAWKELDSCKEDENPEK